MNRDNFIEANLNTVREAAMKHMGYGATLDDLMQEGMLGLITARGLYDGASGVKFEVYASYYITRRIVEMLVQEGRMTQAEAEAQAGRSNAPAAQEKEENNPLRQPLLIPAWFPEEERRVLELCCNGRMELAEAAARLKISRERVRQLKSKGLRRLKVNRDLTAGSSGVNTGKV